MNYNPWMSSPPLIQDIIEFRNQLCILLIWIRACFIKERTCSINLKFIMQGLSNFYTFNDSLINNAFFMISSEKIHKQPNKFHFNTILKKKLFRR